MVMAADIRHHIFSLPEGRMFSSRDFLICATRATVDQTLHRLMERGVIVRVARGVYMRETANGWRPSVDELARFKAKTFSKEIYLVASADNDKNTTAETEQFKTTFYCSGGSSSFMYGDNRIYLKGARPGFLFRHALAINKKHFQITQQLVS
ncbi:MAG: type IV toxin-antitoxin system AbiEi family antitoxin domain-containing protein [Candidatus Obscuribacterales bacterium]|nr:type IV toxin-antitoxin system AbiEi family antitoxin domain-containing protein [Candidatus Obscuribacterales bacterium]